MTTFATRQLLRETVIDELQMLPELLRKAEKQYYKAFAALAEKKERLIEMEAELLASGAISIAHENEKQQTLWPYTGLLQSDIRQAEADLSKLKTEVDYLRRKQTNLQATAMLLSERNPTWDKSGSAYV